MSRSNSWVTRKPDRTKNTSTPTYPPGKLPLPAWNNTTRYTATARSPSRCGRYAPDATAPSTGTPPSATAAASSITANRAHPPQNTGYDLTLFSRHSHRGQESRGALIVGPGTAPSPAVGVGGPQAASAVDGRRICRGGPGGSQLAQFRAGGSEGARAVRRSRVQARTLGEFRGPVKSGEVPWQLCMCSSASTSITTTTARSGWSAEVVPPGSHFVIDDWSIREVAVIGGQGAQAHCQRRHPARHLR